MTAPRDLRAATVIQQVVLSGDLARNLDKYCDRTGLKKSEVMRRALAEYLRSRPQLPDG